MTTADSPIHGVPLVRLVLGVFVVPAVVMGVSLAWAFSVQPRLPDPMATHWNAGGQVNGTMTFDEFIRMPIGMALVLWALGAVLLLPGRTSRVRFHFQRWAMVWCCATTAFTAAVMVMTIQANLDRPASTAKLPAVAILAMLGVAVIGALIAWALAGPAPALPGYTPQAPRAPEGTAPSPAALAPGAHPVWRGHLTSVPLAGLTGGLLLLGLVLVPFTPVVAVVLVVCAICCFPLTSITVVVDETGLLVRFGPFGWPHKRVRLDSIAAARSDHIEPMAWGGWGYRMMPGRSAVVVRGGPGIVLELTDGRAFAVTVDDPDDAAALVQAYRQRAASAAAAAGEPQDVRDPSGGR